MDQDLRHLTVGDPVLIVRRGQRDRDPKTTHPTTVTKVGRVYFETDAAGDFFAGGRFRRDTGLEAVDYAPARAYADAATYATHQRQTELVNRIARLARNLSERHLPQRLTAAELGMLASLLGKAHG